MCFTRYLPWFKARPSHFELAVVSLYQECISRAIVFDVESVYVAVH